MYTQRPNIAPIDLELNYDSNTYYVVASALPMREKNFKKACKKKHCFLVSARPLLPLPTAAQLEMVQHPTWLAALNRGRILP